MQVHKNEIMCSVLFSLSCNDILHIYTDMFNLCEGILLHTFIFCLQNSCHSLHLSDIYSPDHIAMYLMIYILTVDTTLSWLFVSKSGVYFIYSNNVHTFKITFKQIDPYLVCISYFKWSSKNLHKPNHTMSISCIQNLPHKQTYIMCIYSYVRTFKISIQTGSYLVHSSYSISYT